MFNRTLSAELCFILHTASVSGFCVLAIGLMRLLTHLRSSMA